MTNTETPLNDYLMEHGVPYAVVAMSQLRASCPATVSAVRLTKTRDDALVELKRMVDVVTERSWRAGALKSPPTFTMERGGSWANVKFSDGVTYAFSVEKAGWVAPPALDAGVDMVKKKCCGNCNRKTATSSLESPGS